MREIVKEQAIYKRERMVSVQVLPYVLSKVFLGLVFAAYSSVILFGLQILSVDFSHISQHEHIQLFLASKHQLNRRTGKKKKKYC